MTAYNPFDVLAADNNVFCCANNVNCMLIGGEDNSKSQCRYCSVSSLYDAGWIRSIRSGDLLIGMPNVNKRG